MPNRARVGIPPPAPVLLTLTLHGTLVDAREASAGELALLEAIRMLAKLEQLRGGHVLTIERM
jgi:hypothetical protein